MTKLLLGGVVLYLSLLAILWLMRFSLIYPLDPTHVSPAEAKLPTVTEHALRMPDGVEIMIWTSPAPPGAPTVLYFCGNAGNLANRAERFRRFQAWGYGLVAMSYRGAGGSGGTPNEAVITADAELVRARLADLTGGGPSGPVVYYGESLGAAVAVKLSRTFPPDGLILEAPFTSVPDIAAQALPIFPARLIIDEQWNTRDHIRGLTAPLLIIHGTDDKVVPYAHGQTLFDAATADRKRLLTVEGGTHFNLWSVEVQKAIAAFLQGA